VNRDPVRYKRKVSRDGIDDSDLVYHRHIREGMFGSDVYRDAPAHDHPIDELL
jgi:hypothetical protein